MTGNAERRGGWSTAFWTLLATLGVLWPARVIGPLDGVPLDGRAEAIAIGLVLPSLWWLDRRAISTWWSRTLILGLLLWKVSASALLTQQGLCAAAFAKAPLSGSNQGIPIEEPSGALRSWDLRADFASPAPECTAILTRPLPRQADFPAWFLNVTDALGPRDFTMTVRGYLTLEESRTLTIDATPTMRLGGGIDRQDVSSLPLAMGAGTHQIDLTLALGGGEWQFEPRLDGRSLWSGIVTTAPPRTLDRVLGAVGWIVAPVLILALMMPMALEQARRLASQRWLAAWTAGASLAAAGISLSTDEAWHRAAGAMMLAAVAVPVGSRLRSLKGAFLLVGVPWLTFHAVSAIDQIGRFSIYSKDDWLTYQVAGHRIYMQGYWLEGGNAVFDFQPLYRWMTGALHLIFGDSSVGERYWDAACLLMGALLSFQLVRLAAGFRWALFAAAAALASFTLATPWHFIGRGLSEIAAAGWAFLAMWFLLRARRGRLVWVVSAAVCAVLMFYTRLNHLLFGPFLAAMLLPLTVVATPTALARGWRRMRPMAAMVFTGGFATGVFLFALRTWHYTGTFSLFHGTSLNFNDTGLRPWTLLDRDVWSRVAHSLWALIWMNEPSRPDLRAAIMATGALVAIATIVQLPIARRVPASLLIATIGATAGSFFAHGHPYPGRFSIHVIPLFSALTAIAAAAVATLGAGPRAVKA